MSSLIPPTFSSQLVKRSRPDRARRQRTRAVSGLIYGRITRIFTRYGGHVKEKETLFGHQEPARGPKIAPLGPVPLLRLSGHPAIPTVGPSMLKTKILNPHLLSLLARVRHTNAVVIADRGFPFWPQLETVDLSLTDDIPTVLQVLSAVRADFHAVQAFMACEFIEHNTRETQARFAQALGGVPTVHEAHTDFKKRVPDAIGLIRTGDTAQYANVILVSG